MRSFVARCLIVLTCVVAASCWNQLMWKSCGGTSKVQSVTYDGQVQLPNKIAILKKGTNARLNITFQPDQEYTSAKSVVKGIISGIPVTFPLDNPDVCKNCSVSCPMEPAKTYSYVPTIAVRSVYPSLTLVVEWAIEDLSEKTFVCITVGAKIVS